MGEEKLREKCEKAGIDPDKTLESYVAIPKNDEERKLVGNSHRRGGHESYGTSCRTESGMFTDLPVAAAWQREKI